MNFCRDESILHSNVTDHFIEKCESNSNNHVESTKRFIKGGFPYMKDATEFDCFSRIFQMKFFSIFSRIF